MKSLPPESGINPPDEPSVTTDFQSLATAVSERPKVRESLATDLASLRKSLPPARRSYQRRTIGDYLIESLTPTMIFLMVYTVIFFLLDVRYVFTAVHDPNLRFVTFCFVMGIVALNRLIARDGSNESMFYIVTLAGAIGLYTVGTTEFYGVGSVSRNFMNTNAPLAAGFNMTIVALVWWTTNRLMHECCVDENPETGEVGLVRGTFQRMQKAMQRNPEIAVRRREKKQVFEDNVLEAYDPTEWKKPEPKPAYSPAAANRRLSRRHPGISVLYFSVPAMLIFVLGLPVVRQGGDSMVRAGRFYMGCYTVSALMLLLLSSLGGLREYFRARRVTIPSGIAPFWIGLGVAMMAIVMVGAGQLPKPGLPPVAYVDQHQVDPWSRGSHFELMITAAGPMEILESSRFMDRVGRAVLVFLAVFIGYGVLKAVGSFAAGLAQRRDILPRRLRRFFEGVDRVMQRVTRLPAFPRVARRVRVSRDIATCGKFKNPLGAVPVGRPVNMADAIAYTYQALCALAHDLGVPREKGQTPYEFLASFPDALETLREEASELTQLYVLTAYAGREPAADAPDRLRRFWLEFERVRRRTVV